MEACEEAVGDGEGGKGVTMLFSHLSYPVSYVFFTQQQRFK